NREFVDQAEHIQLRYSNALATADLSRAELLHPIDGWHASVEGHNVLADLNRECVDQAEHIQLRYSNALATADLSRAELLHPIDGWHASVEGHNVLADAAFSDLKASL